MSLLTNIKEQGKSGIEKLGERIKESAAFAQAMDRYESLSPGGQQGVRIGLGFLVLLIVLFIPLTNLLNSRNMLITFEENRNLIRELFKTYRESSVSQSLPVPPSIDSLSAQIQSLLQQADLMPEQNLGVSAGSADGKLIPKNLVAGVLTVSLAKLNLKQIVDIGTGILGISGSVKMRDIAIVANAKDTRYYDVTYTLYSLKVPEAIPEAPPEIETKPVKSSGKSKGSGKGDDAKGSDE